MKKTSLALFLTLLSGGLAAQTVITVNGTKIDSSEVDAVVKNLQRQNSGQPADNRPLRDEITRRLAISTVIAQEAKKLKLDQTAEYQQIKEQSRAAAKQQGADKKPSFKQEWAMYETELLNQAYFADVARKNPVSDADVKKAYDEMNSFYKGSQEIQLGEIVTRSNEDAQKALGELKSRKSFKDVAAKYSIIPQAKQTGGILPGYMPLKDLEKSNPPMYQAVGSLKKGEYTPTPLAGDGNVFAIFYINDKRNVKLPPFNEIKPRLTAQMQEMRIAEAVDALVKKADIKPAK